MAGPKTTRGREIAPLVRRGFERAIENLKKGGTIADISDIFEEMIATDPFKAFDVLAKFTPKELMIEQNTTHRIIAGEAIDVETWEREHVRALEQQDTAH